MPLDTEQSAGASRLTLRWRRLASFSPSSVFYTGDARKSQKHVTKTCGLAMRSIIQALARLDANPVSVWS
ncbi:hypothetical protein K438DRAFT_1877017, partial [Mycena galopus ATCC 62051]